MIKKLKIERNEGQDQELEEGPHSGSYLLDIYKKNEPGYHWVYLEVVTSQHNYSRVFHTFSMRDFIRHIRVKHFKSYTRGLKRHHNVWPNICQDQIFPPTSVPESDTERAGSHETARKRGRRGSGKYSSVEL